MSASDRVLWIDGTAGVSGASLLAALVDVGVAPSPILHALADLGLPTELRIDACARGPTVHVTTGAHVRYEPRHPARLLDTLPPAARPLAVDALQRLALAQAPPGEACPVALAVEAADVALVAAVALAVAQLAPTRVLVSRVGVPSEPDEALLDLLAPVAGSLDFGEGATTREGAALLRALATREDEWGAPMPSYQGTAARGESCEAPTARALLGRVL